MTATSKTTECGTCDGSGIITLGGFPMPCSTCEGTGRIPLDDGDDGVDWDATQSGARAAVREPSPSEWLAEDRRRRRIASLPRAHVYEAAARTLIRATGVKVEFADGKPAEAYLLRPTPSVRAQNPTSPQALVELFHEIGHATLHHGQRPPLDWRAEAEASEFALAQWKEFRLPEQTWASYRLCQNLWSYVGHAIRSGETTAAEVLRTVPGELLEGRRYLLEQQAQRGRW